MTDSFAAYIICGTPRSGSTMLCEMLGATRAAGRPNSYYREPDIAYWADQWGVPHPHGVGTSDFDRAYLAAMLREGRAETGIFGMRIMWASIADATRRLGRVTGTDLDIAEQLETAFGHTLYLHITRADKVAQAVSRLRAEQSGVWHLAADGSVLEGPATPKSVSYDSARIAQYVAELQADDASWATFFADRGIAPLRLAYETMTAEPKAALAKVLAALDLNPELARDITVPTAKMADDTSRGWVERFRGEGGGP